MSDTSSEFEENEWGILVPKKKDRGTESGFRREHLNESWRARTIFGRPVVEVDYADLERLMGEYMTRMTDEMIDDMYAGTPDPLGRSPIGFGNDYIEGVIIPDDVPLLGSGILSDPGSIDDYDT